jgi:site-specific DNA-methyltransferase (adenine-specific)
MIEMNKIYQGDNMDYLSQMKGYNFHLVLTDPPYNIGKDFGNNTDSLSKNEFFRQMKCRLGLLSPCLSPHANILWFCTHLYVGQVQLRLQRHFKLRRQMIWFYENGMSRQTKEPVTEYEPFWWFSKGDEFAYNMDDVRVPYKTERVKNPVYKQNSKGERIAWNPDPRGRKRGDVWNYPTLSGKYFENERTEHPTQKPISLFLDLIRAFCPKGHDGKLEGRVLDPYLGSGTTAVCCEILNREGHRIEWVGMELEQKWVDIANERVANERKKSTMIPLF